MKSKTFWNLPNVLTLARIAAVPAMVILLWEGPNRWELAAAFIVFVTAMVTDIIDGWLARRWAIESKVGAFLDPMADKLMVATVLIMLIPLGLVPAWLVAVLLCRELAITGLRGIAVQEGIIIKASSLGKIKTAYQSAAIGFLLWTDLTMGIDPLRAGLILLYLGALFSVLSAVEYFGRFFRVASAT